MKVKLGDIAVLINGDRGKNYPSQADILPDGEIPFVNAGHLNGRSICFDEMNYISQEKYDRLSSGKFVAGDILYCLRGSLGKKAVVKKDVYGAVASSLVIIRPDNEQVSEDYLMFALDSPSIQEQLARANNGSSQPNLSAASVKSYDIDLPNKEIQGIIVERLSKIRCIIDTRKKEMDCLDTLIKSRFVEMFGDMILNPMKWPEHRLDALADIVSGITKGRKVKTDELYEVPYMAVSNVKDGYIDWTTVKTIMATSGEINQYRLKPGDVLMTEGGDPDKLGRGAIIHKPPKDCIHQNHIFRVRLKQEILLPVFMAQYLQQQKAKRYFLGCAKQTTGIASINMRQLSALLVLVPSMKKQKEFAAFVAQIDKSKAAVQAALDKAQLLFDSLMQQYFG